MPQPPQLAASVTVLVSQPSPGIPLQSAQPALHEASPHTLARHEDEPLITVHG